MVGLLINGVDSESLGFTLAEPPGWLDMPVRDITTAPILDRAGVKALASPSEGARRLTLTGTVRAITAALLRPKIDALKLALLASPLTLVFGDNSTRKVTASLTSFTTRSVQDGAFVQEGLLVEVVLSALDPYSYDTVLSNNGFTSANRMPLGTGPVRPLITLTDVVTNPVIELYNKAGVLQGSLSLAITDIVGDTLEIDSDAKTIKKNGVSVLSAIAAGDFFIIDPADQTNYGAPGPYVSGTGFGGGSVSWYNAWR
jgi:phage-related protein